MGRLNDKVAVITGAGSGIGAAAAQLFVEEGASVFLVDLDQNSLKSTIEKIGNKNTHHMVADVADEDQTEQ